MLPTKRQDFDGALTALIKALEVFDEEISGLSSPVQKQARLLFYALNCQRLLLRHPEKFSVS